MPTRQGWEVLCWYLEPIPGEREDARLNRYKSQLKHPSLWQEVLTYLRGEWDEGQVSQLGDYSSALPRGRVLGGTISQGKEESGIIQDALRRVCTAFHRIPETVRVVKDGHWDPSPEARTRLITFLRAVGYDLQRHARPRFCPEIELTDLEVESIQELAGQVGLHWIPVTQQLFIDQKGAAWLPRLVPINSLRFKRVHRTFAWQGRPSVVKRGKWFNVLTGQTEIEERRRQRRARIEVWVRAGRFRAPQAG